MLLMILLAIINLACCNEPCGQQWQKLGREELRRPDAPGSTLAEESSVFGLARAASVEI